MKYYVFLCDKNADPVAINSMTNENRNILLKLLEQHQESGMSEQIDYNKFYLYSIITHSTAIEGSTVTEVEAILLFDEGITSSKRTVVEQMMNLDLKAAYEYGMQWILRHEPITVEWLVLLASKVMARTGSEYHSASGDFSAAKGELRKLNVTAGFGGKSYMSYQKVPARLDAFCEELNRRRKAIDVSDVSAIYDLSFWAHYELVTIHPWADGNGRMSRLLMNLLQIEFGVLPTKVLKEDKEAYIQALVDTRENDDINIFLDCMARLHIAHLQSDIKQYEVALQGGVDRKGGQKKQKLPERLPEKLPENRIDLINNIIEKSKSNGDKLTENRIAILKLMLEDPYISKSEIATVLGISYTAVGSNINLMRGKYLRRVGPDKGGFWEVICD